MQGEAAWLADFFRSILPNTRIAIVFVEPDTQGLHLAAATGITDEEMTRWRAAIDGTRLIDHAPPMLYARMYTDEIVPITTLAAERYDWTFFGGERQVVAPMLVGQRLLGIVVVDVPHSVEAALTTQDIAYVGALARSLAPMIDQQRVLAAGAASENGRAAQRDNARRSDEFFATAMHEMRNVMASLRGYVSMLSADVMPGKRSKLTKGQMETIKATEQAVECLTELTDDILDVIRLQTGQFEIRCHGADLAALIRRVAKRMQVTTQRHDIAVSAPTVSVIVQMDVRRIEQALTNLIGNAIKYSPDGGKITVTVREDQKNHLGVVSVRDHGIGIPVEHHMQIFQRFGRAANARELGIDGTGLGLYICREIVESHGGRIWFRSGARGGATFNFSLPLLAGAYYAGHWPSK